MMQDIAHFAGAGEFSTTVIPTPLMMTPEDIQRANEYTYSRKYVEQYIRIEIEALPEIMVQVDNTIMDIYEWLEQDYYESKQRRLEPLKEYTHEQMHELVMTMAIGCTCCQAPELFTSITAKLANKLNWGDHKAAITTMSELLVQCAINKLISIVKIPAGGEGAKYNKESIAVLAHIPMSEALTEYILNSTTLPPLLCEPKLLRKNTDSGYLTFNESVTLNGRIHGHLALDVVNLQNQTAMALDLEYLLNVEHVPNKPLDTLKKQLAWGVYYEQANRMYLRIFEQAQGNVAKPGAIYFNHKLDQRGRMYCQGYQINYQGTAYSKAAIELHKVEHIEVPEQYRIAA